MASPRWSRRNARARSLGYRNYYDYRTHNYGAEAPSVARPSGERLSKLRGHRSASDLENLTRSGRIEIVKVLPRDRDPKTKQWKSAIIRVTLDDGSEKEFELKGKQMDTRRMKQLHVDLVAGGVMVLDSPSLDLFDRFSDEAAAEEAEIEAMLQDREDEAA